MNSTISTQRSAHSIRLAYAVNKDGMTCRIIGIGEHKEAFLAIPISIDGYTVTSIANEAFFDCTSLSHVVIGNEVKSIGAEAFRGCTFLKALKISDSVTEIGWGAFHDCRALSEITLGNALGEIGACAFYGCRANIFIPASTEHIGEQAFFGAPRISVSKENTHYTDIDGNLCSSDGKILLQFATGKTESSFTVPNGITKIGVFAFGGAALCSVMMGNVDTISENAFYGCNFLTDVTLGKNTREIRENAFGACPALFSVRYEGKKSEWRKKRLGKFLEIPYAECVNGKLSLKKRRSFFQGKRKLKLFS